MKSLPCFQGLYTLNLAGKSGIVEQYVLAGTLGVLYTIIKETFTSNTVTIRDKDAKRRGRIGIPVQEKG
jgi:glycyl-tRNA synthetase (class II)